MKYIPQSDWLPPVQDPIVNLKLCVLPCSEAEHEVKLQPLSLNGWRTLWAYKPWERMFLAESNKSPGMQYEKQQLIAAGLWSMPPEGNRTLGTWTWRKVGMFFKNTSFFLSCRENNHKSTHQPNLHSLWHLCHYAMCACVSRWHHLSVNSSWLHWSTSLHLLRIKQACFCYCCANNETLLFPPLDLILVEIIGKIKEV